MSLILLHMVHITSLTHDPCRRRAASQDSGPAHPSRTRLDIGSATERGTAREQGRRHRDTHTHVRVRVRVRVCVSG